MPHAERHLEKDDILGFSMLQGLIWLAGIVGLAWLWWYGEQAIQINNLSLGALVMCAGLVVLSFLSIGERFVVFRSQDNLKQPFEGLRDVLIQTMDKNQISNRTLDFVKEGRVSIRRLRHDRAGLSVLNDISLDIAPGQLTAIISPEKSSRSALLHLIAREDEPAAGNLSLDDYPYSELSLQTLQSFISLVPELPFFFDGTVRDNLSFAQPQISTQEVLRACDMAFALPFQACLDDGLETLLGKEGAKLSRDTKRRLAIARAVLQKPRVLLLDNPLSGLGGDGRIGYDQHHPAVARQIYRGCIRWPA